jgi:hypothetical protein
LRNITILLGYEPKQEGRKNIPLLKSWRFFSAIHPAGLGYQVLLPSEGSRLSLFFTLYWRRLQKHVARF